MLKSKNIYNLLIVVVLILISSYWLSEILPTSVRYFLILGISLLLYGMGSKVIQKRMFYAYMAITGIQLLSFLLKGGYEGITTGLFVVTLASFVFTSAVDQVDFIEIFRKFMIVESICAIVVYFLYLAVPALFDVFPTIYGWREGRVLFKNAIVAVVPISMSGYYRSFGFFSEPGMHAIYLNIAIIVELFFKMPNIKVLALFMFAIVITMSTNGLLVLAAIMMLYFFTKTNSNQRMPSKYMKYLKYGILFLFLCGTAAFFWFYQNGYINDYLFTKLLRTDTASGLTRRSGYMVMLEGLFNNPVLGMGLKTTIGEFYVGQGEMLTATILNCFGTYGMIYGTICTYGYIKSFVRMSDLTGALRAALSVILILIPFSQDLSREFIFLTFVFYGYKRFKSTESIYERFDGKEKVCV